MTEMLLDTTIFYDYRRGDLGAREIIERIIAGQATASVSPLTVFALWNDVIVDRRVEMRYAGLLSFVQEAPLSWEAAKMASMWLASVVEEKMEELTPFALVAATARERGEPICTSNPEPFSRFYSEFVGY